MNVDLSMLEGKRVCVALSGGGDSVALLHFLRENARERGIRLSAVNIEHGIRGERSRGDTAFCVRLCRDAGVPLRLFAADIPALARLSGRGIEEEARLFRQQAFLQVLAEGEADVVATAHHAGDNAESVLFNLFRGASLTGAGGIRGSVNACELAAAILPEARAADAEILRGKSIVRPLLAVPKAEILAYLRENKLEWREDESNADPAYTRNFLRKEVLAPARERFPALDRALYNFSRIAREDDEFLYGLARQYFVEKEGVCTVAATGVCKPLFVRACVLALRHFGVERDYTLQNLLDLCDIAEGENGRAVDLPRGVVARSEYGAVSFYREEPPQTAPEYPFGEGTFDFGKYAVRISKGKCPEGSSVPFRTLYIDGARLPERCILRTRKEGDVFRKFGSGTKKLKEYFIDAKIPQRLRGGIPLIACGKEVLAVCGREISEKVKIGANADVYTISLTEKGE